MKQDGVEPLRRIDSITLKQLDTAKRAQDLFKGFEEPKPYVDASFVIEAFTDIIHKLNEVIEELNDLREHNHDE